MQHNLKKSQKITKTEETGIYCYFFTIYLIKLFKFFFPFLLVISCDFVLVFFAGHRSMAATLLLQKMVALATDVNFPWLINFLIGIILQDTKTEIQSTIKKNINIRKATRADILHMSINIIQATDIKPVILFSTSGS